ncbi:MAG: hypothetical protein R3B41_00265 [Candidatus Doudnabacteria bacterium]
MSHLPKILKLHIAGQSFDHAYLFLGPKSAGKYDVAQEFIDQAIQATGWHREVLVLDFAEAVSLDQVRQFLSQVKLTTLGQSRRFALILNFELANSSAVNALLKTLEEPPASTIFVLLANAAQVLPTVMSRCTVIRFTAMAGGLQELRDDLQDGLTRLNQAFQGSLSQKVLVISELAKYQSSDLVEIFGSWLLDRKTQLGQDEQAIKDCRNAQTVIEGLQTNRNTKLVLQDFFLN